MKLQKLNYWRKLEADPWNDNYKLCIKFEKDNMLTQTTVYKGVKIGTWLNAQRSRYKKEKLDDDRLKKLQRLSWWKQFDVNTWDNTYKLCVEFEEDNTLVQSTRYKKVNLGKWLSKQKQKYKKGKLDNSQLDKLRELDYWKKLESDPWDVNYKLCIEFEEDNTLVQSTRYKKVNIGSWIGGQKSRYSKKGYLDGDRLEKLQKLKWWQKYCKKNAPSDSLSDSD